MNKKVILLILDGWGVGKDYAGNAITKSGHQYVNNLSQNWPTSFLHTSGENVGLPDGQMGNSEVGHMNIGAGRVVYQQLVLINKAFNNGEVNSNPTLIKSLQYALDNNKKVHLIGLFSDGGVHSHLDHIISLCHISTQFGIKKLYVHAFMDGRDTDPKSGIDYVQQFINKTSNTSAQLASLIGRYYAMDRDKRWERVKLAYDLLISGVGSTFSDPINALKESYQNGITDEFVKPIVIKNSGLIEEGDVVINVNFRTDRGREITMSLTQQDFPDQQMKALSLNYLTMTSYDESFKNIDVLFENKDLNMTLGEVIERNSLTQVRIAETEKYPHVTFFFSGGRETPFHGESRMLCPSPKVATYDLKPEMSAIEVKEATIRAIENQKPDLIITNFANPDMVGHTGVLSAAIKAVETVDGCVEEIVKVAFRQNYSLLITADHGNSEYMINDDGSPNTAHTTNVVPLYLIDSDIKQIESGRLADLAPTILKLMGIEKPIEMTGNSLI